MAARRRSLGGRPRLLCRPRTFSPRAARRPLPDRWKYRESDTGLALPRHGCGRGNRCRCRVQTGAAGGKGARQSSSYRQRLTSALLQRQADDIAAANTRDVAPLPSMIDGLFGAIDIMQERISEHRLASEPPDVLLIPRLEPLGPFAYHRAALAIAEGRDVVALMLPAINALRRSRRSQIGPVAAPRALEQPSFAGVDPTP